MAEYPSFSNLWQTVREKYEKIQKSYITYNDADNCHRYVCCWSYAFGELIGMSSFLDDLDVDPKKEEEKRKRIGREEALISRFMALKMTRKT